MTKLGKKNQKRLAKLVSMALMCTGGLCSLPSVASATEATVTNVTEAGGVYTVTCDPLGSVGWMKPDETDYCFPTAAYDVLNIKGTFNTGALGFLGGYGPGIGVSGKTVNIKDNGTNITVLMLYGGLDDSLTNPGSVEKNTVNIASGTIFTTLIGGGYGGIASDNHVNITGGTINYGGYGCNIFGGGSGVGDAENNTVTISGGEISPIGATYLPPRIEGGSTSANGKNAKGNVVTIGGDASITGTPNLAIYGGSSIGTGGNATDNTVTISGNSTFGNSTASIYGGYSQRGAANDNTVEISGGTISGTISGGSSEYSNADNNKVNISGGTIKGTAYIIGGIGRDSASNNTVTIEGDASVSENTYICGGQAADLSVMPPVLSGTAANNTVNILKPITVVGLFGGIGDETKSIGNTLNIAAKNVTVGSDGVAGFQNMNFYLPTDMTTSDTMLTVNGTAAVDGAKVGVMAQGKLANLTKNDKVTLLHAETMNGTVSQTTEIDVPASIATVDTYEFNVTSDTNNIYATITKAPEEEPGGGGDSKADMARENTKSVVETKAATTTFINAGADMLASQGFSEAANAVAMEMAENAKNGTGAQPVGGFTPFAAFGGSSLRAESGSHVDTKGFGLNVGFARELPNSQGKLLFGPVVEYGGGSYDSYLDNGIHGDGNAHYFGLGLMARQVNHDGFYYEGSLRGGRVKSDYKGAFNLQNVDYDSSSNYWAAHLGFGKVFAVGGSNTLDGYVKYFYSHQSGDSVTLHGSVTGDEDWSFDSVDSNRIRIGARLTHKVNERNSFYGGLAYQYEFSGDATAHYADGSTPSPSVKGSSGLLELGWQVKPGEGPLTLDLGVTGWAGKQRGGSVQLGATWSF